MTRKDYIAIADVIAAQVTSYPSDVEVAVCERVAQNLASVMQADNPRFDRGVFLQACRLN